MPKIKPDDQFYMIRNKDGWIEEGCGQSQPKLYKIGNAKAILKRHEKRYQWSLEHHKKYPNSGYAHIAPPSWEIVPVTLVFGDPIVI